MTTGAPRTARSGTPFTSASEKPPAKSRAPMRVVSALAYVVVTIVGSALFLEGAISFLLFARDATTSSPPRDNVRPHLRRDSLVGWSNRPGAVSANEYGKNVPLTIDSNGFRSNPIASPPAGAPVLACSGDGYTLGYGVDDAHAWCALLQSELRVTTVNLGEPGYGLDQTVLRYARDGVPREPAIHVLALNEVQLERTTTAAYDGFPKPSFELRGGRLSLDGVPVAPPSRLGLRRAYARRTFEELRFVQWLRRFNVMSKIVTTSRAVRDDWPTVDALIDSVAKLDSAHGTALAIAYLPTRRDLRPSPLDERRELLAKSAKAHGVPFFDLALTLRAMRPDSVDHAYITGSSGGGAPAVANQLSNLGNVWVARELASRLHALPGIQAKLPR